MHKLQDEYEGKHRFEDMLSGAGVRRLIESAMRGVPNESPRHAAPQSYATPNPYQPCVINSQGQCTRWSHDHSGEASS